MGKEEFYKYIYLYIYKFWYLWSEVPESNKKLKFKEIFITHGIKSQNGEENKWHYKQQGYLGSAESKPCSLPPASPES